MMMLNRSRFAAIHAFSGHRLWIHEFTLNDRDFLLEAALELGAGLVGLKMGDRGFVVSGGKVERLGFLKKLKREPEPWAEQTYRSNAFQVDVKGSTGAGDATIAGFLMGLLRGFPPGKAVEAGCAVGACCVEALDAVS